MSKKYHRTTIRVTVLSEEPLNTDELSLEDIHHAITDGDCVGKVEEELAMEMSADEMAEALIELGSDPAFFGIQVYPLSNDEMRDLCSKHGVRIVEAEEDEVKGMWDWLQDDTNNASDTCFTTEREAMQDAIDVLDLLDDEENED